MSTIRRFTSLLLLCTLLGLAHGTAAVTAASVQARGQAPLAPVPQDPQVPKPTTPDAAISVAEIQSMFDAMLVMQAEQFVGLSSEQFPPFVARVKKLQELKVQQTRRFNKAFNELRQLANPPQAGKVDEAAIDAKLKELDAIDAEGDAARARALEAVNQLLTPRQRARYRLLEDSIEKRKLDFLVKVRQPPKGDGTH